jgi:hypothetical protein
MGRKLSVIVSGFAFRLPLWISRGSLVVNIGLVGLRDTGNRIGQFVQLLTTLAPAGGSWELAKQKLSRDGRRLFLQDSESPFR